MKALKFYKELDPRAQFALVLLLIVLTLTLSAIINYRYQLTVPQPVPNIATTIGVVEEAMQRYYDLNSFAEHSRAVDATADPEESVKVGIAGYFIADSDLNNILGEDVYRWGKSCGSYYNQDIRIGDRQLAVQVYTSGGMQEEVAICSENLPNSIIAREVTVFEGDDGNLYYRFKKVTLTVKYVLVEIAE